MWSERRKFGKFSESEIFRRDYSQIEFLIKSTQHQSWQDRKWIFFWRNQRKSIIKYSFEFSSVFPPTFSHFSFFFVLLLIDYEILILSNSFVQSSGNWEKKKNIYSSEIAFSRRLNEVKRNWTFFCVVLCSNSSTDEKFIEKVLNFPTKTRRKSEFVRISHKIRNRETVRYHNYPQFDFEYKKRNLLSLQVIDFEPKFYTISINLISLEVESAYTPKILGLRRDF